MQVCPYPWYPGGLSGVHPHRPHRFLEDPLSSGARWPYDHYQLDRCCEFCDVWEAIVRPSVFPSFPAPLLTKPQPDIDDVLLELSLWDPYRHALIMDMYHGIHGHYMMGYDRDGPESFFLSREVEKLSRALQRCYRKNPWSGRGIGDLASQLKYAGRDLQIGPRRRKYHVRPRPRYWNGDYYPGERWWRH